MPKVSIIILNWNQPKLTVNCVNSVLKQGYKDFEILLIDNHSEDDSFETLKNIFGKNKKIRLFQTEKNIGYAGGNNFGVKKCKGEYVVILNNDTVVDKNWLSALESVLDSDDKIAAVSSNERLNGVIEKTNFRTEGRINTILQYPAKFKRKSICVDNKIEIFSIKGSSFIFRKNLAKQPFPNYYFAYGEDMYLGWLFRIKGFKNYLALNAGLDHFHNTAKKSDYKFQRHCIFLGERNRWINFLSFYDVKNIFILFPLMIFSYLFLLFLRPKYFYSYIKVLPWLIFHSDNICKQRKIVQLQRLTPDKMLFRFLSSKFYEEDFFQNKLLRFLTIYLNKFFKFYLWIFQIKTADS